MNKQKGLYFKALVLLLFATIHIASGATINSGEDLRIAERRDAAMSQVLFDTGETIKCLLQLSDEPEIPDKIHNVWKEHLNRIQLHPTKPLSLDISIDVLFEKAKETLKQLQAIDNRCSRRPYDCQGDTTKFEIDTPTDLNDMANSLQTLAGAMFCVISHSEDRKELYRLFDQSFERIHSNFDTTGTALSRVYDENQQLIKELKNSNSNCETFPVKESKCFKFEI